jgi:hypothetical protein
VSDTEESVSRETRRLPGHRARVVLTDGTEHVARVTNREYVLWDKTAPRHKWGSGQEVPFRFATFLAFAALKRDGLIDLTFEKFEEVCEVCDDISDEEEEEDVARPTKPGRRRGSS